MGITTLVEELKENNQDFEFYPTTKEMLKVIYDNFGSDSYSVLDIGCGTCNFKKYFDEFQQEIISKFAAEDEIKYQEAQNKGESYYKRDHRYAENAAITQYYVIEKSRILLNNLDSDTIVLGTDFNSTLLIDKKVSVIFCNPPYSEFEEWAKKIIWEGNCKYIYLIIPQRWKENAEINKCIEDANATVKVLGSFDFLHAERQARAKVDIVFIDKRRKSEYRGNCYHDDKLSDLNEAAFDKWFDDTFKMRDSNNDNEYESSLDNEKKESIKNQLVGNEGKAKILVELYQAEQKMLYEHFMAISSLDVDVLRTIGVLKKAVKEALKQKIKSLKALYWKLAFEELDEITNRLTSETRKEMFEKFSSLLTVDFTIENIYPLILWVIKNANQYYNDQLIDLFKKLSSPENVKMYKSNQKVFERDEWRHSRWSDADKVTHYTLDYRIVCDCFYFGDRYSWKHELDKYRTKEIIGDICTIANNLGFKVGYKQIAKEYGQKYNVYMEDEETILFEYKYYKNGNTHIKFNKEFAKAMNVEVSRLLGWIRDKEDISKEFTPEMATGAEKYFKTNNYINLASSNLPLLECKGGNK